MKAYLCHTEADGNETRIRCYGADEKELRQDMLNTAKRLNWDIKYCSIGW